MLSPNFRVLFVAVSVVTSVAAQAYGRNFPGNDAPGLKRQDEPAATVPPATDPASEPTPTAASYADSTYKYNLTTGLDVQVETSLGDAEELYYTTDNGAPYPMPYDALRIGSSGMPLSNPTSYCY